MPQAFDNCVASGGRVRTISLPKGKYMHICYPKGGGSPIHGEVKISQTKKKDIDYVLNVLPKAIETLKIRYGR